MKEPQRVRDLLQGTASLEFWTTYDAREVLPILVSADKFIRSEQSAQPAAGEAEVSAEAASTAPAAGETSGLIAEVGADSASVAESARTGNYDREENPLFAVLDPSFAGGAAIGAAYKADKMCIRDSLEASQIDEVILVGGSTRIPAIQKIVQEFFGKAPNKSVNPDEVLSLIHI